MADQNLTTTFRQFRLGETMLLARLLVRKSSVVPIF
jgi:hypothetical protein